MGPWSGRPPHLESPSGVGLGLVRTAVGIAAGLLFVGAVPPAASQDGLVQNGGFESGDLAGWTMSDHPEAYEPAAVLPAGVASPFGLFVTAPADDFALVHPFDGGGAGTIELYQEVDLPSDVGTLLTFDLRAGWDLERWCIGCEGRSRDLDVVIEAAGGGDPQYVGSVLRAEGGTTVLDSGPQVASVDLSAFAGESIRLVLRATVPDDFTGPARLQLDSVELSSVPLPPDDPDPGGPGQTPAPVVSPGIPGATPASPAPVISAAPGFVG